MILKWAYGYQVGHHDEETAIDKKSIVRHSSKMGDKYVHQRSDSSPYLAYFDPPQPGYPNNKLFIGTQSDIKPKIYLDNEEDALENEDIESSADIHEMMNLKELNQPIKLGEYFGDRFVMPVAGCSNILSPSMEHESITLSHWLQLVVTIKCNGKSFDLKMDSPSRMLHCRVVLPDDECQTILPPSPSYEPGDGYVSQDCANSTIWEQREAITSVSGWGASILCPCETK